VNGQAIVGVADAVAAGVLDRVSARTLVEQAA